MVVFTESYHIFFRINFFSFYFNFNRFVSKTYGLISELAYSLLLLFTKKPFALGCALKCNDRRLMLVIEGR